MATTVLFDTLKMAEKLEAGGFSEQQARTNTTALGDAATIAQVATRGDVMDLGIGLKHDFEAFKTDIKADSSLHKTEIGAQIAALELRMTIKFGGMMLALATIILAGVKYLR